MTYAQYVDYLKAAYEEINPTAKVNGLCSTGDLGGVIIKFLGGCFGLGAMKYCDIVDFHSYRAALDWSSPVSAEKMTADIKLLMKNYGGENKELWHTELYYIGLDTADNHRFHQDIKGHEAARRFLIDLACGVSKSFCVPDS